MTKLRDVIEKKLTIPFGDIVTSPLATDEELCREIQQILYENNFYRFEVDGIYGKITREALRDFKESYALSGGDLLGSTTAEFLLRADKPAPVETDYDFSTPKGTQRAIIRECRKQGLALNTQIAYVLATVQHETAHTFKPVKEAFWLDEGWRRRKLWYFPYYGRGFVQLTHRSNYQKYSNILGINLADEPDRVMEPKISLFILIDGMAKGRFTGARLGQFVNSSKTDFVAARKVVNPGDKAHAIKDLAESWLSKINLESIDSESPVLEMPEELEILLLKQVMDS
ncbi:MAG: peptidoglycan-binding protein [Cyanobacteriota bacterium]